MRTPSFANFEKAIKSGFQERALSILKADERHFTKGELKKAYEYGKSNAAILKYLIELSIDRDMIDVSENEDELIRNASRDGHKKVVELLLARDPCYRYVDPSAKDNEAIQLASKNGHKEVVELLLACEGVDPSARDNDPIRWASENGHKEVVRLLLACDGVDPSAWDNYAIRYATLEGHLEVVKLLLMRDDVDPSVKDNRAIRWASEGRHKKVVELLMADPRVQAKGIARDILDKYGKL